LGILYDKEDKKDLTQKTIEAGLKANPDHPELVLMKAMFAQEQGDMAEAEPDYRKVIQLGTGVQKQAAGGLQSGHPVAGLFQLGHHFGQGK
jgi:Tfp pilus assembly protein PilF